MYSVINSLVQYQQYSYNPILSSGKTLCPPSPNKCRNLLRLSEMDVQFILMRRSPRQGIGIRGILTDRCKLRGISALMCPHLIHNHSGPLLIPKQNLITHISRDQWQIPFPQHGMGILIQKPQNLLGRNSQSKGTPDRISREMKEDNVGQSSIGGYIAE
mmetsp:Transcript_9685/g.20626  ORF Transcript_9685/g.20626 Transcript_9685/m.20626 type:complete len:159 (+) Transcript_9685:103-579(+)